MTTQNSLKRKRKECEKEVGPKRKKRKRDKINMNKVNGVVDDFLNTFDKNSNQTKFDLLLQASELLNSNENNNAFNLLLIASQSPNVRKVNYSLISSDDSENEVFTPIVPFFQHRFDGFLFNFTRCGNQANTRIIVRSTIKLTKKKKSKRKGFITKNEVLDLTIKFKKNCFKKSKNPIWKVRHDLIGENLFSVIFHHSMTGDLVFQISSHYGDLIGYVNPSKCSKLSADFVNRPNNQISVSMKKQVKKDLKLYFEEFKWNKKRKINNM